MDFDQSPSLLPSLLHSARATTPLFTIISEWKRPDLQTSLYHANFAHEEFIMHATAKGEFLERYSRVKRELRLLSINTLADGNLDVETALLNYHKAQDSVSQLKIIRERYPKNNGYHRYIDYILVISAAVLDRTAYALMGHRNNIDMATLPSTVQKAETFYSDVSALRELNPNLKEHLKSTERYNSTLYFTLWTRLHFPRLYTLGWKIAETILSAYVTFFQKVKPKS